MKGNEQSSAFRRPKEGRNDHRQDTVFCKSTWNAYATSNIILAKERLASAAVETRAALETLDLWRPVIFRTKTYGDTGICDTAITLCESLDVLSDVCDHADNFVPRDQLCHILARLILG